MLDNSDVANVLEYWKLCEISDFDRFSLKDMKLLEKLDLIKYRKEDNPNFFKIPKLLIHRVYYGLIKTENLIKYVYQYLKEKNIIININDESLIKDLERINSQEYTYLAYFFVNHALEPQSINSTTVVINPIFYILKYIQEKEKLNNNAYKNYIEDEIHGKFVQKYDFNKKSKNYFILESGYLENIITKSRKGQYFNYFNIEENIVVIPSKTLNRLEKNIDSEKFQNFLNHLDNMEQKAKEAGEKPNIRRIDDNKDMFSESIRFASDRPSDFIYYCTFENKDLKKQDIPINMSITKNVDKEKTIIPSHYSTDVSIDTLIEGLKQLQIEFEIPQNLISSDKAEFLIKEGVISQLKNINGLVDPQMVSFYLDALDEKPSILTTKYIEGVANKIDVNNSDSGIRKKINQLSYFKNSSSRWISSHYPFYAQQAAINLFLSQYNEEGNIFSVNGPPGTGKTTLLKDVIANIISKKTQVCCDLKMNIFDNEGYLQEPLCSTYEILVVSNNNAAVENITLELPKLDDIDFGYLDMEYEFLLKDKLEAFYEQPAWALISTKLGNSENVNQFKSKFEALHKAILDDAELNNTEKLNKRLQRLVEDIAEIKKSISTIEKNFASFEDIVKYTRNIREYSTRIEEAENKIAINTTKLNEINKNISTTEEEIFSLNEKKINEVNKIINVVNLDIEKKSMRIDTVTINIKKLAVSKQSLELSCSSIKDTLDVQKDIVDKFGFLSRIFKGGKFSEEKQKYNALKLKHANAKERLSNCLDELASDESYLETLKNQVNAITEHLNGKRKFADISHLLDDECQEEYKNSFLRIQKNIDESNQLESRKNVLIKEREEADKTLFNDREYHTKLLFERNQIEKRKSALENQKSKEAYYFPEDSFFSKEEAFIQTEGLFKDKKYMLLKSQLFTLSMLINETLFLLHKEQFKENIYFYFANNMKRDLLAEELEKLQKAFSALFFIFPVISTSLASSYNMLRNIKNFGTVLCDESGQATPQSIIATLNRARNALIVGDPLQVEPVFTAPEILVNIFTNIYQVKDLYTPFKSSVQQIADHANTYGSYYKVNGKDTWVGMPLVVHRRCIEPMFSISNEISYNKKMILKTPDLKPDDKMHYLPESCWIDVKSSTSDFPNNSNSSIKERKAFEIFFREYQEYLDENFYIIAPFKSIYNALDGQEYYKNSEESYIGTVHTFQGKEADVVFFMLGGNVERPGSKGWVSSKANILNVANTRAKKRIYIIGDYDLWKTHKYFDTATKILNRKNISELMRSMS